jgi:prevent-host-death family protein
MNITVADLKANLDELLRKAANGEELRVTSHGKPYVRIAPAEPPKRKLPRVGAFEGQPYWMAPDFDELGPEWDEYVR